MFLELLRLIKVFYEMTTHVVSFDYTLNLLSKCTLYLMQLFISSLLHSFS